MADLTNVQKLKTVNSYLDKLMNIAEKSIEKRKYERASAALSAYCDIQNLINQVYTDKKAEELVLEISRELVKVPEDYKVEKNTILFYDGFGLDLRGWAAAYVRAIIRNGYKLVYVTKIESKHIIPHIENEMKGSDAQQYFINMTSDYTTWICELNEIIVNERPKFAFFYTTPYDVAAAAVFDAYKDKIIRAQVDLTDHAYWIGINAADYFLECRVPGASNAIYNREIEADRIINIDCCLYINHEEDKTPLPFDIESEKYVFSGGALYKTLGDKELLFYRVISEVLRSNPDVKYLYAGYGDGSELEMLKARYPGRVYHIAERSDFYRLIENCVFMWNTYPMFGGLMMRFAANARKVPLTLKHGKDHEGLLINQSELGIEFDTYEEVVAEANRLLQDEQYRHDKEKELEHAVLSEEAFARNLKMIIEEHNTEFHFGDIPHLDTRAFQNTYIERIEDPKSIVAGGVMKRMNRTLYACFPELFVKRVFDKARIGAK